MMLKLENLTVKINNKEILKDINLEFEDGVYAIRGPNGSGKTTLLKTIAGFYKSYGKIIFNEKDITNISLNERAKLGIIYAYQVLPLDLEIKLRDLLRTLKEKNLLKKEFDIFTKFKNKILFKEFSGGEAKLIDFFIALSLDPKVFLIDEIDSGLDEKNIELVGNVLKKLKGKTIILTTHTGKILEYLKPKKIIYIENGEIKNIGEA